MRKSRKGLKKVGLLALALVIALGSLGVAYGAWTDSVYIEGTVETGTLDIRVKEAISMFVYKVPGGEDIGYGPETAVIIKSGPEEPVTPPTPESILIASAAADFTNNDTDEAEMHFSGLFPEFDFQAKLCMQYFGSIPVKVSIAEIAPLDPEDNDYNSVEADIIDELWALGESSNHTYGIWIDARVTPFHGTEGPVIDPLGVQLHLMDIVCFTVHVRLPQDPAYENLTDVDFIGDITVVQWNLYGVEDE